MNIADWITAIIITALIALTLRAISEALRLRKLRVKEEEITGEIAADEVLEAKFCWRKDNALVFDKDGEMFAVDVTGLDFKLKFIKGKLYKLASDDKGLITILR